MLPDKGHAWEVEDLPPDGWQFKPTATGVLDPMTVEAALLPVGRGMLPTCYPPLCSSGSREVAFDDGLGRQSLPGVEEMGYEVAQLPPPPDPPTLAQSLLTQTGPQPDSKLALLEAVRFADVPAPELPDSPLHGSFVMQRGSSLALPLHFPLRSVHQSGLMSLDSRWTFAGSFRREPRASPRRVAGHALL